MGLEDSTRGIIRIGDWGCPMYIQQQHDNIFLSGFAGQRGRRSGSSTLCSGALLVCITAFLFPSSSPPLPLSTLIEITVYIAFPASYTSRCQFLLVHSRHSLLYLPSVCSPFSTLVSSRCHHLVRGPSTFFCSHIPGKFLGRRNHYRRCPCYPTPASAQHVSASFW